MNINIKELIKSKSPSLSRRLPNFVINYFRRIIHEDEVNSYLTDFKDLTSIEFSRACLKRMNITYNVIGLDKIEQSGRYIFASNHPFGGLDGLILTDIVAKYLGDAKLIVNDILMNLTPLQDIFVPINKHGRQSTDKANKYNETFNSNVPIITFPAGVCSRRIKNKVQDLPWKNSFVKKAIQTERDIIPVYFDGELSNFFYRIHEIRTKLGIKANIEMLYLVDEMFKQSNSTINIYVGKPILWQNLTAEKTDKMVLKIRKRLYTLKK